MHSSSVSAVYMKRRHFQKGCVDITEFRLHFGNVIQKVVFLVALSTGVVLMDTQSTMEVLRFSLKMSEGGLRLKLKNQRRSS